MKYKLVLRINNEMLSINEKKTERYMFVGADVVVKKCMNCSYYNECLELYIH